MTISDLHSRVISRTCDYYRCPEEFTRCFIDGEPSRRMGYFHFGSEAICYGSVSKGKVQRSADEDLHDALDDAVVEDATLRLSFDPDQTIDNLLFERYCENSSSSLFLGGPARHLYYLARPFLGAKFRRRLQKLIFSGWQSIPFPHWPVDRTVDQLHETMLRLCLQAHDRKEIPFIWFWPKDYTSCAVVTHDVETVRGRDFCPTLMDIDESFGLKSSFQLVPEERYALSPQFIENILARGFEVNVHDLSHDGYLFISQRQFFDRIRRINQYGRAFAAQGFRSGGLYRNLSWYGALEFSYDMSVPNTARLDPQRGGCCTVMPYFIGKILELPVTTTQDYSLFYILNEYSIDLWMRQIARIMEKHGLISFIVHPDYITEPREQDVYKSLLAYLANLRSEGKVWTALPQEVNQWWRARSQMKLVRQENSWVIEGPEKDKAQVAFAVLDGDCLAYELAGNTENDRATRISPV